MKGTATGRNGDGNDIDKNKVKGDRYVGKLLQCYGQKKNSKENHEKSPGWMGSSEAEVIMVEIMYKNTK